MSKMTDEAGREVEVEIEFNSDGSAYFHSGQYVDNGAELSEEVLDELGDAYPEELEEAELDRRICAAEALYDARRDR